MARFYDTLRDPTEAETLLDSQYEVEMNMADEIRNLPVRTATSPQDAALYEAAGFVPGQQPNTYVSPQRAQAIRMAEREHQKQLAREQLHQERLDNPFFKVGDALADTGRLFLSPLFWLSGEDTTKYDPSAVLRAKYQNRFDQSVNYTEALYEKVLQAAQLRDKYRETLITNRSNRAFQTMQSQFAGISTTQKDLLSFAKNSGQENLDLYKAGTADAYAQLQKNYMLSTDQAIPLIGINGQQIIVPKNLNETFNRYGTRFEQTIRPKTEAFGALDKLRAALKQGSTLAEVAAVTQFNKVLDPGSVVRESEVKLTAEARGIFDTLMVKLNNVAEGDVLDDDQVKDMLALADALEATYIKSYKKARSDYENKFINTGYADPNVIEQYLGSKRSFGTDDDGDNVITIPDPVEPQNNQPTGGPLLPEFLPGGEYPVQQQPDVDQLLRIDLEKYYPGE